MAVETNGVAASNGAAASAVATRESIIAELEAGGVDQPPAKPDPAPSEPDQAEPEEPAADQAEPEAEPEGDEEKPAEDGDDEAEDDETGEPDADEAPDRETSKSLSAIRKHEQRAREAIARDRAELERARADHAKDVAAVREFAELRKRWRYDRIGVARALGAEEGDYEDIARAFFAHSSKGAADPRNKEAVERSARERELQDRLDSATRRLDERDAAEKRATEEAAAARAATRYLEDVAKSATAKTAPLAAHFLAKSPQRTRTRLGEIALHLADQTGEPPSAREVLAAFEKLKAEEMREYGVDPTSITKKPATAAKPEAKATAKDGKRPAPSAPAKEPTRDEIVAELEAGRFD